MQNEFLELCVFCHHQKHVLPLQDVTRGLSGRLCFQMHVLLLWKLIENLDGHLGHLSCQCRTPALFSNRNPIYVLLKHVFLVCNRILFSHDFFLLLHHIASCIFLLPLPTPIFPCFYIFAPRLKLISVYTVFLCNIKSSDIKQRISTKTEFRLYYSIIAYLYTDLYKIIIS